jgi:hypothetical protein
MTLATLLFADINLVSVKCTLAAACWVGGWLSREPGDAWGRLLADR